jgi:hypothetical protein
VLTQWICTVTCLRLQYLSQTPRAVWIRSQMYLPRRATIATHRANSRRRLRRARTAISVCPLSESMSEVASISASVHHAACGTRASRIFLIEPLTRWPRDARCDVAAEAPCAHHGAHHGDQVLSGSSTLGGRTMRVSELERERVSLKPLDIDERPRASRPSELGVLGCESDAAPCCC